MTRYTRWTDVPEHFKTKTQLGCAGLIPGGEVQAIFNTQYGEWNLYDRREVLPKRTMIEAHALDKAPVASAARCCKQCGRVYLHPGQSRDTLICDGCQSANWLNAQHTEAAQWARGILAKGTALILDTETPGE